MIIHDITRLIVLLDLSKISEKYEKEYYFVNCNQYADSEQRYGVSSVHARPSGGKCGAGL